MNVRASSNLPTFSDQACETGDGTEGKEPIKIKYQRDQLCVICNEMS